MRSSGECVMVNCNDSMRTWAVAFLNFIFTPSTRIFSTCMKEANESVIIIVTLQLSQITYFNEYTYRHTQAITFNVEFK